MKKLLKKILSQFIILMFTFTFVNLDVAITKSDMQASFIQIGVKSTYAGVDEEHQEFQEAVETQRESNSGIKRDEDGIASKEQVIDLKGGKNSGDIWTLITMLGLGIAAMSLLKMCQKFTGDIMLAAAGGLAFIIGEIIYVSEFKKLRKKRLSATLREDGEMENKQVQTLEEQKGSYEDMIKAAQTKITLQTAAAVAFGAAAAWAGITKLRQTTEEAACISTLSSLAATYAATPEPTGATKAMAAACGAGTKTCVSEEAFSKVPMPSSGKSAKITGFMATLKGFSTACVGADTTCFAYEADKLAELGVCMPLKVSESKPNKNTLDVKKFFAKNLKLDNLNLSLPVMGNNDPKEDELSNLFGRGVEDVMQPHQFASFIDKSHPLYNLSTKSIKKDNESELQFYIRTREEGRYLNGKMASMSLNEYSELNAAFPKNSENQAEFSDILMTAAKKGMDLVFPQAHAGLFDLNMLGITGAVVGIVWGVVAGSMGTIDMWIATPGTRAIGFAAMSAFTLMALNTTKKIKSTAEENRDKLNTVLTKMKKLSNVSVASIGGTYQQMAVPNLLPLNGNPTLPLNPKPTPCLVDGSKPGSCASTKSGIEKDQSFISLPSGLSQIASQAGSMADGMVGKTYLSGGTLDTAANLASQQNAISKLNEKIKKKLNKLRKDKGLRPINHNKMNKQFAAMVKRSMRKGLKGSSASDLMAAFGGGGAAGGDSKASDGEKQDDVASPDAVKVGAVNFGKGKKSGLNFNFDDGNNNTNLEDLDTSSLEDSMAANQAKADDLEETGDDIHTNVKVSIFKIISVRYLKSGYSKLLEEEK